jgi:hypothetical protein
MRKLVLSKLSSIRTHFPFMSSLSQSYTSWNIFAFGSCRLGILTRLAIFWKLCSNRAALLAWTQKTHASGDLFWVRYAYSMVSCDLLCSCQSPAMAEVFVLTRHCLG